MIIPIKCFTCGKVIADKYEYYVRETTKFDKSSNKDSQMAINQQKKTIKHDVMENLGIKRMCCKRHFMTHVDIL
jgi:DNA-directed RNA polymerase subunit N (RpoN/RPB10)